MVDLQEKPSGEVWSNWARSPICDGRRREWCGSIGLWSASINWNTWTVANGFPICEAY